MCVTTYLKAMLTDGFLLSVSSRAANSLLRIIYDTSWQIVCYLTKLSSGWLLTIYYTALI